MVSAHRFRIRPLTHPVYPAGAERAMCAIIALDSPSANYRAVYAMTKHFPSVKTFVRARDVNHGVVLEKAGATAVVPETLEPSLQLAAAALTTLDYQQDEVRERRGRGVQLVCGGDEVPGFFKPALLPCVIRFPHVLLRLRA